MQRHLYKKSPLLVYLSQCLFGMKWERIIRNEPETQRRASISSVVRLDMNWKDFNPEDFFQPIFTKTEENSLKNLRQKNEEIGLKVTSQACLYCTSLQKYARESMEPILGLILPTKKIQCLVCWI